LIYFILRQNHVFIVKIQSDHRDISKHTCPLNTPLLQQEFTVKAGVSYGSAQKVETSQFGSGLLTIEQEEKQ